MGNCEDWTLLDQIHGLLLALRIIEQSKQNIDPDQYKYVTSEITHDQRNYARFLAGYIHFSKQNKKRSGSDKLLSARVITVPYNGPHSNHTTLN